MPFSRVTHLGKQKATSVNSSFSSNNEVIRLDSDTSSAPKGKRRGSEIDGSEWSSGSNLDVKRLASDSDYSNYTDTQVFRDDSSEKSSYSMLSYGSGTLTEKKRRGYNSTH